MCAGSTCIDTCDSICNSKAKVVVAMYADREICHSFDVFYDLSDIVRCPIAYGIGDINSICTTICHRLEYLKQEFPLSSCCIFCRKFYLQAMFFAVLNSLDSSFQDLPWTHLELILHMD